MRMLSRLFLLFAGLAAASAADLDFQRIVLLEYEDGPPLPPGFEHRPGETIWFNARVDGYAREVVNQEENLDRVRVSWQVRALDPEGTLIAPPARGIVEETLRPEDKTYTPKVLVSFMIPQFAPRGTYKVTITVRDDVAKKDLNGNVEFRVRGDDPVPQDAAFGIRNFRFLAKEDDRFPLKPAVFKPGGPMFARFDVIGYKFEGNNHFSIDYSIEILGPPNAVGAQKSVLKQDMPTADQGESFYPQRWVPGGFALTLDPKVAAGEYTLVVTIHDKIGNATAEGRQSFEIRP